jgi:hypothetical protein
MYLPKVKHPDCNARNRNPIVHGSPSEQRKKKESVLDHSNLHIETFFYVGKVCKNLWFSH